MASWISRSFLPTLRSRPSIASLSASWSISIRRKRPPAWFHYTQKSDHKLPDLRSCLLPTIWTDKISLQFLSFCF
jgi:hypothetical protein